MIKEIKRGKRMDVKPNIIFITVDQVPAAFLSCYGGQVKSTPVIDRLSSGGMRFDRCYASVPVCAPNRANIFTGRSSQVHGIFNNNYNLQTDTPTIFRVLQNYGYRTGGFGKFHLTSMGQPLPENFNYLGFDESTATEDPKLGPWLEWIREKHPEHYEAALSVTWPMEYTKECSASSGSLYDAILKAREKILDPLRQKSPWPSAHSSPLPAELHQTTWITDISLDFMRRHLAEHSSQPFCAYVSYVDPHDPYDPPAPYDKLFSPGDMTDPVPKAEDQLVCKTYEETKGYLNFKAVEQNRDAIKLARALYHGSMRFLDDQIGRIISFLENNDLSGNTIIVFTSDHGDMLGDHSLPGKGDKHFDKSIRCPLIVTGTGVSSGTNSDLVCSLDFFPTFCEIAGLDQLQLPPLEGKSFCSLLRGEKQAEPWPEVTIDFCIESTAVRSVITSDAWRFTVFDEDNTGEMFDLKTDADEQRNLFYDPSFTDKKLHLYECLTRAYMHISQVPQYRNLPEISGFRHFLKPLTMGDPGRKINYY
jgi:arylsulfatase A-like enzyme